MNDPIIVLAESYSEAWARAIVQLSENSWEMWNLVVTIKNPALQDSSAFEIMTTFATSNGLLTPKKVQHTIFPQQFYDSGYANDREKLYKYYDRFYKMTRKMERHGWGTYFKRMIEYKTPDGNVDQLARIIDHINTWPRTYRACHYMLIPQPHTEGSRPTQIPCLNYIAVQVEPAPSNSGGQKTISLLAVYRNHDFLERTFGNYLGLCNLLEYICQETNSKIGYLTCVSSHAYADKKHQDLYRIAKELLEE